MCQMVVLQMLSHLYKILFRGSSEVPEELGPAEVTEKIEKMETKIAHLEQQNKDLQKQLDRNRNKEAALQKVLCNYDNLLKKVIMEKHFNNQDNDSTMHLANLESAFYDLLEKYEKAKFIVEGFQKNETALKKQVEEYESILDNVRSRFLSYQTEVTEKKKGKRKKSNKNS